jgi:hypothetical protein
MGERMSKAPSPAAFGYAHRLIVISLLPNRDDRYTVTIPELHVSFGSYDESDARLIALGLLTRLAQIIDGYLSEEGVE